MSWQQLTDPAHFVLLLLVLCRTGGMVLSSTVLASLHVPSRVRLLVALALALVLAPTQAGKLPSMPGSLVALAMLMAAELLVGAALGAGVRMLLVALELAGQTIGQAGGLHLAETFNVEHQSQIPLLAHFLHLFGVLVFFLAGGHRVLVAGLLHTFEVLPPGELIFSPSLAEPLILLGGESLTLALRCAAPALAVLLLVTLATALVSRTLPQLNLLSFGFGFGALATLGGLALSLGTVALVFDEQIEVALHQVLGVIDGWIAS